MSNLFNAVGVLLKKAADRFTDAIRVISNDEASIQEGMGFRVSGYTAAIAPTAKHVVAITTGNSGKYVHMRPAIFASISNLLEVVIMEGAVVTGGTPVVPVNQNRNSAVLPTSAVLDGVTISEAGTVEVGKYLIGSGGAPATPKSGGSVGADNEIILKPNTTYSITLTNIGTVTDTIAYWNLFWHEQLIGV